MGKPIYRQLDAKQQEVRLLLVEAGCDAEPVRCELRPVFLTSSPVPEYETVSYCWGDANVKECISLNGVTQDVPASAEAAIRRLRRADTDRVIWIDAICINQDDITERGEQVGLMQYVYSKTKRNLVWLGEDDGTTEMALETIESILEDARGRTKNLEDFGSVLRGTADEVLTIGREPLTVLQFYARPWFRRLWVAQEACLPQLSICYCGPFKVPLLDVLRAAAWLRHEKAWIPSDIAASLGLEASWHLFEFADRDHGMWIASPDQPLGLGDLLTAFRGRQVTDPRDRVYGVLGMYQPSQATSQESISKLLTPDYERSQASVLQDATRFVIAEERKDLSLFLQLESDPLSLEAKDLPSWVPPWGVQHIDAGGICPFSRVFTADDGVALDCATLLADNTTTSADCLLLRGIVLGSVVQVTSIMTPESVSTHKSLIQTTQELFQLIAEYTEHHDLADEELGALLLAGEGMEIDLSATREDCLHVTEWLHYVRERGMPVCTSERAKTWGVMQFHIGFKSACRWRRMFTAANGLIGLGPRYMAVGDLVVVLYGCKWPVVLRRSGQHYIIVGLCYVQGIMFGEAVRKHKDAGNADEAFVVR